MRSCQIGQYSAYFARNAVQTQKAQRLRAHCFGLSAEFDADEFDAASDHVLIQDIRMQRLIGCFRLSRFSGAQISESYSAQHYDLSALEKFSGNIAELGRFCIHPQAAAADALRVAWATITAYVDRYGVRLLCGCSSFAGTQTGVYNDSFALLKARHLAPEHWRPGIRSPEVYCFAKDLNGVSDPKQALIRMPSLLRTYLIMGGWVSDHAVIDRQMNTMHVFTGVEIDLIPHARARRLRALADMGRAD